jgi:glycosyltransferase involved in cell wall biosynthesis
MRDIDRFLSFLPDKIICNSEAIRKRFYRKGKIEDKIITIINGVDIDKFNPKISGREIRKEFAINEEEVVMGITSRIDPEKGHEYFLRGAAEVVKNHPGVRFLIVGDAFSPEHFWLREYLKKLTRTLRLEDEVIFAGFRKDMPQVLAGMDILVLASDAEPCGRVLFEAMACGKPLIATNTGGTPEIVIDRETGLLVPPRNSELLARALITLLNNNELRKEMGQKGRKRIEEHFTIEKHVEKTEAVYEELLLKEVN